MKFHDVGEKPSQEPEKEPKVYYPNFNVTTKRVPELADYDLGDVVEFHVKCVVVRETKREGTPKDIALEMRKVAIINLKQIRKDAEDMGLSVDDVKEINSGRKKKNA